MSGMGGRVLRRELGAEYEGGCAKCGGTQVETEGGRLCKGCRWLVPVPMFSTRVDDNWVGLIDTAQTAGGIRKGHRLRIRQPDDTFADFMVTDIAGDERSGRVTLTIGPISDD
jgi:hypothetical protein